MELHQTIADSNSKVFIGQLKLESGVVLDGVELAYERKGPLDAPVILVCHALTGNQFAIGTKEEPGWWSGLIGEGKAVDTKKYQVISFNVLGGCNGSTGPLSLCPKKQEPYRGSFPYITIRDMVRSQQKALQVLGIDSLKAVMGGSLGGMQVLEWGVMYPDKMEHLLVLAATPVFSDYGIAFNQIGITAIENDPNWKNGNYSSSEDVKGFHVARMAGMVTYRSSILFSKRFERRLQSFDSEIPHYEVESYLQYQGEKLARRFDVNSYLTLLRAMNSHDIGRERGGFRQAAGNYKAHVSVFTFQYDLIYPADQMKEFVEAVPHGDYFYIPTEFGHDGFLVEFSKWGSLLQEQLDTKTKIESGRN